MLKTCNSDIQHEQKLICIRMSSPTLSINTLHSNKHHFIIIFTNGIHIQGILNSAVQQKGFGEQQTSCALCSI